MICNTAQCSECPAHDGNNFMTACKVLNAEIKASEAKAAYYNAKRNREADEAMR